MNLNSKIFIANHTTMIGAALVRALHKAGYENFLLFTQDELDLLDQHAMLDFYYEHRPEYVFDATQKVNHKLKDPIRSGQEIYEHLQIQISLIHGAWLGRVKKLLLLSDSSIYSLPAHQPLTKLLDSSHEAYAIAEAAGIKMCQTYREQYDCNFITVVASDLYGPNDTFEPVSSRILPSLIFQLHHAKMNDLPAITIYGNGTMRHEYLHVDDLADACLFLMNSYDKGETINISSEELTANELAHLVKNVVSYQGQIDFDHKKTENTFRKFPNNGSIKDLGWRPHIPLAAGLLQTYEWFLENHH